MDTIRCIKTRRSIRKFLNKDVPLKILKEIVDCGRHAPSSFDSQPWEFIIIKDKKLISKLLEDRVQMKKPPYDINSIKFAEEEGIEKYEKIELPPAMIVICGDKKRCEYTGSLLNSLAVAAENILLATHSIDLGACWLYVYDPDTPETERAVRRVLKLPPNVLVLCLIILGYPKVKPSSRKLRRLNKIIHIDKW